MTPLPVLLVVLVASVPGTHCSSFDQPDTSSSSSYSSYLYDTDSEGLGQTEYHLDGKEGDESGGEDLDEGVDEDDLGGYLLAPPPRKKLDASLYPATSNARERLFLNLHGPEQQEESRRLMKRSQEKTVKQLIRLCRNTNEGEEPELAHLQ